jgi:PiT family inorganic phosphate transporter
MHDWAYMQAITFLFLATCFLAYSNGANDNFKGVASLFGSRTCSYKTAISWATITTGAGSIAAIFLAQSLLKKFSGKGLIPDALTTQPAFLLAVALGAGATVIADTMANKITDMNPGQGFAANLATALLVNTASYHGLPVSTTHVSVGSLLGIGITTRQAKWKPVTGVLLSWVITLPCAAALAALAYLVLHPR